MRVRKLPPFNTH